MHFLRKKDADSNSKIYSSTSNHQISAPKQVAFKMPRIESPEVELVDISTLQHDPGLCPQI
jgi:hypothetical protein